MCRHSRPCCRGTRWYPLREEVPPGESPMPRQSRSGAPAQGVLTRPERRLLAAIRTARATARRHPLPVRGRSFAQTGLIRKRYSTYRFGSGGDRGPGRARQEPAARLKTAAYLLLAWLSIGGTGATGRGGDDGDADQRGGRGDHEQESGSEDSVLHGLQAAPVADCGANPTNEWFEHGCHSLPHVWTGGPHHLPREWIIN